MINEVIVVEGRDDTRRLREVFGPQLATIETQGSAVSAAVLARIRTVAAKRDLIILTDPDFNGEQIRKKVLAVVPEAKQAFLPRKDAAPQGAGSLGVEHASAQALRHCLAQVLTTAPDFKTDIRQEDLIAAGLLAGPQSRQRREQLGDFLHIGYVNGKQLWPRLRLFQITRAQLQQAVKELGWLDE